MAIVGKLLRQKWAADAAEKKHEKERAAERIRFRQCAEQALAETRERFPVLTADNFEEANNFRENRLQDLLRR